MSLSYAIPLWTIAIDDLQKLLGSNQLAPSLSAERLRTLNWRTNGTINDELRQDTKSAGHTKQNSVVVLFSKTIVLQQDTGVSIDVGVWVLGLSVLGKNARSDLVNLGNELEHWVIWEMLLCELALGNVAGVGLAENSVAVTWNDLAGLKGGPEIFLDLLVREIRADRGLHLLEPDKDFLVGETVKRTSKTVQAGCQ
jgi:hypothetical protein